MVPPTTQPTSDGSPFLCWRVYATNQTSLQESILAIFPRLFENMNKLTGFAILLFTILLLIVSSVTYVKKASAIYFGNGACPSGEARDYMGICFPVKECKASLFAAPGTCTKLAPEPQCTTVNGEQHCTITAWKYHGSPIVGPQTGALLNKALVCKEAPQPGVLPICKAVKMPGHSVGP
jgi:hypothetical protein